MENKIQEKIRHKQTDDAFSKFTPKSLVISLLLIENNDDDIILTFKKPMNKKYKHLFEKMLGSDINISSLEKICLEIRRRELEDEVNGDE